MQYDRVSNAIRFDSLLLAATARSLDRRLAGRAVRGLWLDRNERSLLIRFAATVRKGDDSWLHWHLHPTAGDLTLNQTPREPVGSTVQVAPGSSLRRVHTLADERVLCIELDARDAAAGFARCVYIELIGSRWNAIATAEADAIIALLQLRDRGHAVMRPGARYVPPAKTQRAGAETPLSRERFREIIQKDGDEDVRRALIREVAYTSPINATYIGAPIVLHPGLQGIDAAFDRYTALLQSNDGFILKEGRAEGRGQPYPSALGNADAEHAGDMVDAFARVTESAAGSAAAAPIGSVEAAMAGVHERIRRIDERIDRLAGESRDATAESARMRHHADLLFAQLHRATRGAKSVELDDFAGGTLTVALDPTISAQEHASRLHEQAKRRDHAAERVPAMIERASTERARLADLQQRLAAGSATSDEIAKWSREALRPRTQMQQQQQSRESGAEHAALPYRVYRTTSGLEVRAGRNSRANDQLTFHHSKPDDIWLHARDYAGSHVVLRWTNREANPSARDIEEAAIIAAVHSRGRTSGLVPVDWTRRKYVRKRRHAPPGQVVVDRSKTLFVKPDEALERRLREV